VETREGHGNRISAPRTAREHLSMGFTLIET
jgi:hypothetical protein